MSAHTPGPLAVEHDIPMDGCIAVVVAGSNPPVFVAEVSCREDEHDESAPPREVALANARLFAGAGELLAACKRQHHALDVLLAMLIQRDPSFFPTRSGIWPDLVAGNEAIAKVEGGV